MDQNNQGNPSSDTPQAPLPQTPEAPKPQDPAPIPESPVTPPPPAQDAPPPPVAPATPPSQDPPASQQTPPPPMEHKTGSKKTIAVGAAVVSVVLVILGVYAMTQNGFNTQTEQQAAAPVQTVQDTTPSLTPTPSDVVEQDLGEIEEDLQNVDQEASMADQGLSATPADLQ